MTKKFNYERKFSRTNAWTLPLFSITSLLSILAIQWLPSNSQSAKPEKPSSSPSSFPSPQALINAEPVISNPKTQFKAQAETPTSSLSQPLAKSSSETALTTNQTAVTQKAEIPKPKTQPKKSVSPQNLTLTSAQPTSKTTQKSPTVAQKSQNTVIPTPSNYKAPSVEIRVAVLRDATSSNIGTSTTASILDSQGRTLHSISANQGLGVQANGSSLLVGDWQLPSVVWVQPDKDGFIYVGDRWYRGKLLLVSQGNSFLAVNYIDLEQYLYSVVGSEMHANASIEALKAQAIAARSYALVHMIRPASPWYSLGATQRWQAYKGIEREYNTTHQAVNETAGQVLSHKGGVVESLYAATDDIVTNVHKGRGMSQTGAYQLAKEGYNYQQILAQYYPGVTLAQLVLQK